MRQPFNVNTLAQVAALAALDDDEHVERTRRVNRDGMAFLSASSRGSASRSCRAGRTSSWCESATAAGCTSALLRRGVIVRPVPVYGFPEHVRVTVGTAEENRRFVERWKGRCRSEVPWR